MYSQEDLNSAVAAGALTQEAANALRAHTSRARASPSVDEEQFHLITGFNDVFVVIALLILLTSIGWMGSNVSPVLGPLAVGVSSWALAEFFTRKRRMALPSILLLAVFVGAVMLCVLPVSDAFIERIVGWQNGVGAGKSTQTNAVRMCFAGLAGAAGAWLHWRRFKVPITVAAGALAVVLCTYGALFTFATHSTFSVSYLSLLAGLVVFFAAVRWDASDRTRQTRNSDVAFWLHLLAAPLLVHPVFTGLGVLSSTPNGYQAAGVLVAYAFVALVSLIIDRRAMMVSSLGYVLFSLGALLKTYGAIGTSFAATALVIGAALLLLSAFWQRSRRLVLSMLPAGMRSWVAPLQ
jgi:hypothetical protein